MLFQGQSNRALPAIATGARQRDAGQSLVEFALSPPLVLALLFGIVEFGRGFQFGQTYDIKLGDGEGGNYNALALDGSGVNDYRNTNSFSAGETIDMEPGNMVGPTVTVLTGRIGVAPNYNWTDLVNPDGTLKGIDDDSPRIITIPIVTATLPGRSDVTITAFAMFYVEGPPSSWSGGELTGAFINTIIEGQLGPLSGNPLSPRVARLVE
ncbi:MAG TPA: TadE family protein [Chloroflexota bacterium]|nr:TadE family protein [Chloroflexota bacterium]